MFRIDKTLVSYDRFETAYTSVSAVLKPANVPSEQEKAAEREQTKAQLLEEIELQLQEKISRTKKEAAAILSEAEEKAGRLISRAEENASGIEKQAEEKGYRDGSLRAEQEMKTQFQKKLDFLQSMITQVGEAREAMIDELEGEIISLILETAKKVININLEKDDKVFVDLVQNALGQMKREGKIIVRVSQEDYAEFFSSGNAEFILNNERVRTTVIEEPLFKKGDCVIESDGETVNAGVSSQLKYVELAFRNEESHIA